MGENTLHTNKWSCIRVRITVNATKITPFRVRGKMHGTASASSNQTLQSPALPESEHSPVLIGTRQVSSSIPSMNKNGEAYVIMNARSPERTVE